MKTLDLGSTRANVRALKAAKKLPNKDFDGLGANTLARFLRAETSIGVDALEAALSSVGARLVVVYDDEPGGVEYSAPTVIVNADEALFALSRRKP